MSIADLTAVHRAAWSVALDELEGIPRGPAAVRARSLSEHAGPLDLGCALNPSLRRTPALELLSVELERVITTPGARLIVSFSPQEGKTSLLRMALLRKLQYDPHRRNVIASYAVDLARTSGRAIRQTIDSFGSHAVDPATHEQQPDRLGIAVARDHFAAADWTLHGYDGGLVCVGVGSGLTGRPVDGVLAVDDPLKGAKEADSALILSHLHDWWQAISETRLAPESSIVVIATRWAELDLSGWLIDQDQNQPPDRQEWRVVNIPALADGVTLDALNRPAGEWMESARGRTVREWEAIRRRVGERVFAALYQGRPAPLAGGWFLQDWFDRDRVVSPPADTYPPFVYVDPADNTGGGDEAGIIVGRVDPRRHIYVGPDYTLLATTARWVRVALLAVVRHGAAALVYEKSLSGLARAVREGWTVLRKQALMLHRLHSGDPWPLMPDEQVVALAMEELTHEDDSDATRDETFSDLLDLWPHAPMVLSYPPNGPAIRVINPQGKKLFRLQAASPALEQRRVHVIGRLPEMEHEAVTWQPGQASPNRLDTLVHLIHDLSASSPGSLSKPSGSVPTRSTRRHGSTMIPRSARR